MGEHDTTEVLRYAAFTDDPAGGNPAGVVIAERLPSEDSMQRIAAEVGYSETAFVAPRDGGPDLDVRYFSPVAEVAFCGHATIATGVALGERDPTLEAVALHTRTERVEVAVGREEGRVVATLTSPPASHAPVADAVLEAALAAFGWDRGVLDPAVPPVVASAGVHHLVLAVDRRETLAAMDYAFDRLRDLMLAEGWTTVDVVWRESATRFHARNPFPVGGVVEDPATGAAAAALGGYLRDAGLVEVPARLTVLQGEDLGRPSVLVVAVPAGTGGIDVSGTAVAIG